MNYTLDDEGAILIRFTTGTGAMISGAGANTQVAYFTAPNVIASDAGFTYNPATDTATLSGGFVMNGGAASVITVNDNVANALTLVDAGGIEYLRLITTNTQPVVVWNHLEADVDHRWGASGIPNALFIQGSNGYVGFGTASPDFNVEIVGDNPKFAVSDYQDAVDGGNIIARHARGTEGTPLVLLDDDRLGGLYFMGWDGAAWLVGAQIEAHIDGAPGVGDYPTRLTFDVTANGDPGPTTRMTIVESGNMGVAQLVPTGRVHAKVIDAAGIPVLVLEQLDISEGAINFIASDRGVISGATNSLASVRVEIGGVVHRLALYVDA